MNTDHKFLAFDLGATSGRAIVGGFEDGKFSMEEIHRFPNGAQVKCGCFHWNTDELFGHIKAGLKRAAELGYDHAHEDADDADDDKHLEEGKR